jgi:Transcription factor WhiB
MSTPGHPRPAQFLPVPPMPEALRSGTCARHPRPRLWEGLTPADREEAVSLCRACPAVAPCAAWALSLRPVQDEGSDVLGGLTQPERARIRRERQRALRAAAG